ncbi:restriction endonuclease subunit S [Serratia bockelmannii]|uniref:restriction endonuclease subunit S n=1 Tax=Serratia TaxID=613 RepID=UPI0018D855CA|nr:restriction endonuclease subunit S [Serratia marcescens]
MVPEGWKVVTLGDVIHESAFGPRFSAELYSDNGNVGTIRTTDLDNEGNINYKTIPYANLPDSFEAHYLKNNDLLITRSGTCGIPCLFEKQDKPIIAGAFLIRFILKDNVHPKYIHSLLKSEHLQRDIHNLSSGGVQKNLSGTNLKKLKFSLPPFLEQKKIARILCTWDKAINTTKQMLANSQRQKKGLMQQLLTGKRRFMGFKEEWRKIKLAEVADMNSGGTPSSSIDEYYNGGIPWVSIADMTSRGKWISSTDKTLSQKGLENSSARLYPENTVLYAMYASIGECSIARVPLCSSQAILGIRPNKELHYEYLYFFLSFLKDKVKLQGQQGTQSNLNAGMVRDFIIFLPSIGEQKIISSLLNLADQEIEILKQKLNRLEQEKKALMQQLLTGKRRVKTEAV